MAKTQTVPTNSNEKQPADKQPSMVGRTVLYYSNGETNRTPWVAIVVGELRAGCLSLVGMPNHGGMSKYFNNVYHKDSPELTKRPILKSDCGCWDYIDYDKSWAGTL